MLRLLRAADHRAMPWKNGLGTTFEIAVEPEGASLDAFAWRVSMASIPASGPFSAFPGVDRWIALLDGGPVVLSHAGAADHALGPLAPHAFAGDVATEGRLEGPPARDFNLMLRRGRATGALEAVAIAAGGRVELGAAATVIALVARGEIAAASGGEVARAGEGDAVRADDAPVTLAAGAAGAVVLVASIAPA